MAKTKTTEGKAPAKGGKSAAKRDGGAKRDAGARSAPGDSQRLVRAAFPRLDEVDLSLDLSRAQESARLADAQARLLYLRLVLGGLYDSDGTVLGPPVTVLFEGWDASGKGGAIRRLLAPMDPRHVRVAQFAAPTYDEKRHHFLARFWAALPGWGGMTVMDRSWYGRVMVERVEGLATEEQWRRAYNEIFEFERTLCAEGMILIKFWLHISHEEQARRFERRAKDPLKRWKLTDEDWRNRDKRPAYEAAVEEMLDRTSHPAAPWSVVPADSKRYARVYVLETVISEIERGMRERGFKVPSTPKGLRANRW
jgi:polyphosphate kinase 2 (PPK2 family)